MHESMKKLCFTCMQVVGLKLWIEISYRGAGNLCVVYETSVGTPIFSSSNKFSYFFPICFT